LRLAGSSNTSVKAKVSGHYEKNNLQNATMKYNSKLHRLKNLKRAMTSEQTLAITEVITVTTAASKDQKPLRNLVFFTFGARAS